MEEFHTNGTFFRNHLQAVGIGKTRQGGQRVRRTARLHQGSYEFHATHAGRPAQRVVANNKQSGFQKHYRELLRHQPAH